MSTANTGGCAYNYCTVGNFTYFENRKITHMKGLATLRVKICTPNKLYSDLKMLHTNIYYVPKEVTEINYNQLI
jgi:hypothetical protein